MEYDEEPLLPTSLASVEPSVRVSQRHPLTGDVPGQWKPLSLLPLCLTVQYSGHECPITFHQLALNLKYHGTEFRRAAVNNDEHIVVGTVLCIPASTRTK